MIGEAFKRYKPKNISIGVLQKNYFREANFASFKGSSFSVDTKKYETSILENRDTSLWQSDDIKNSNFIINFNKHILRLSHISILSCLSINCVYNIDVYGSNNGDQWELACKVRKDKAYFKGIVNNAECKSSYSYKMYKLMQNGASSSENYLFSMYYLFLIVSKLKFPTPFFINYFDILI